MKKITLISFVFAALGMISLNAQFVTHSDNFATAHDYVADGVEGTIWDGYGVNTSTNAADGINNTTVEAFEAVDGGLLISSLNGNFEGASDDGAYVYRIVKSGMDFEAELNITDGYFTSFQDSASYYNSAGIVVRNPDYSAQNNMYFMFFEIFNIHSMIKSNLDGVQTEIVNSMDDYATLATYPYMKVARLGNLFTLSVSADGFSWTETVSVERADFEGIDLEVGVTQCNFTGADGDLMQGAVIDNFSLTHAEPVSVESRLEKNTFKAYSSTNNLIIESENDQMIQSSKLYSIIGSEVASLNSVRDSRCEFSNLKAGIYIAEVNINGVRMTKKVVIR